MNRAAATFDRDPTLADVETLLGAEIATALAEAFGGNRLYLPREPGRHHPLSIAIGSEPALELGRVMGGLHLDVPLSPGRRALILRLMDQGLGPLEIRRKVGCSRGLVFKVLRAAKRPDDQLELL